MIYINWTINQILMVQFMQYLINILNICNNNLKTIKKKYTYKILVLNNKIT